LTFSEQKANIVGMAKSSNREQVTGPDSLAHRRSREGSRDCVSGPNLCTQGAQAAGLPLSSERGLNDDEDRQHFVGSVLVRRRPEFVQHGCTKSMRLLGGLRASDKGNEDRQHFVCAT